MTSAAPDDDDAGPPPEVTELVWPVRHPETGAPGLGVFAKRTYTLGPGRLALAAAQVPLTIAPLLDLDPDGDYRALRDDGDLCHPKVATDVVVLGSAWARRPVAELHVAVAVGGRARRLRVCGERRAEVRGDGTVRFSAPAPFERLVLGHEVAYGGYDERAHQLVDPAVRAPSRGAPHRTLGPDMRTGAAERPPPGLFAYPRNLIGRAYFLDVERPRADGALLPQVEDPSDPLTPERFFVPAPGAWIDAPIPGSLGWVHHAFYPRFARMFGAIRPHDPPARPVRETLLGDGADLASLPALAIGQLMARALQGASPGLACDRLDGDEPVVLQHLHREREELAFELPGEAPRFSVQPPDVKAFTPRATLSTVRIEPDEGRVSLTWAAVIPLVSPVDLDFLDETELTVTWARRSG